MRKTGLLSLAIALLLCSSARGTHIVGGEIYYTCLGGNDYRITLKVYRDCLNGEAPFDNPASIAIYDAQGGFFTELSAPFTGSSQLPVILTNPCSQAPPNICVEEAIYNVEVNLPPTPGGYRVAYQRCCRNGGIINLVDPGAQGSTYSVEIPEEALNSCNSSPRFSEFPPLALCTGDQIEFDHSASDPDGDQLVYSLCTPLHGGSQMDPAPIPPPPPPYTNIVWGNGYSDNAPLDASPQLSIDPNTGLLTGVPTQAGQYVVGVCVEEYRNGQLLSVNNRDFQFNVVNCTSNIDALIPVQTVFHDPCSGLEVNFGNNSINAQFYHWDFGVEDINSDTSNLELPTYAFPDTGVYEITLIANPGYPCADTTVREVMVYHPVEAEIANSGNQCFDSNSFDFEAAGQFGNGATFLWEFEGAITPTSTEMNPTGIQFDSLGNYSVTLTINEGICSDQTESDILTFPRPNAYFGVSPRIGCAPQTVQLTDSSLSATPYEWVWNVDGNVSTTQTGLSASDQVTFPDPGTYDISLTIWTSDGCVDTSTHTIPQAVTVNPVPSGSVTAWPDTQSIFEPHFEFLGNSSNAESCLLVPFGTDTLISAYNDSCYFAYSFPDTGNHRVAMYFVNGFGCTALDTVTVRVEPEVRFFLPNAFTPNGDRLNDTWGPVNMGWREYELWIFDRWGKEVFHTTDPFDRWNGTTRNRGNHEPVPGVYAYRIVARSVKYDHIKESGHVVILK